jgi:hypothetical protein
LLLYFLIFTFRVYDNFVAIRLCLFRMPDMR